MPEDDPTPELQEIIDGYLDDQQSEEAYIWAKNALEAAEDILQAVGEMKALHLNMTAEQEDALEDIYKEAWQWLKPSP
jgi:two-component SAPR family response regulator